MSVGDTIKCIDLDDAFKHMDALIEEGYAVCLEYGQNKTVLTITEVPETN